EASGGPELEDRRGGGLRRRRQGRHRVAQLNERRELSLSDERNDDQTDRGLPENGRRPRLADRRGGRLRWRWQERPAVAELIYWRERHLSDGWDHDQADRGLPENRAAA